MSDEELRELERLASQCDGEAEVELLGRLYRRGWSTSGEPAQVAGRRLPKRLDGISAAYRRVQLHVAARILRLPKEAEEAFDRRDVGELATIVAATPTHLLLGPNFPGEPVFFRCGVEARVEPIAKGAWHRSIWRSQQLEAVFPWNVELDAAVDAYLEGRPPLNRDDAGRQVHRDGCPRCGKQTKRRKGEEFLRYQHRCPHGEPCPQGLPDRHRTNPRLGCAECWAWQQERYRSSTNHYGYRIRRLPPSVVAWQQSLRAR